MTPAARTRYLLSAALILPFASGGCFIFHRAKPEPPTLVINQPIILSSPAVTNVPTPPLPVAPQSEETEIAAAPKETPPPRRPHRISHSHPEREAKETPVAPPINPADLPQLTTQLSPAESAARRRSTSEWLDAAEHDLALIGNRALPAAQEATRSQANEYIRQARQALVQGDLVRAQNLAHKALVLAEAILESAG